MGDNEQFDAFLGKKYKLHSSDGFDEYMKALGVGLLLRKLGNSLVSTVEVSRDSSQLYSIRLTTPIRNHVLHFRLGQWVDETTPDGRKVKTMFTLEKNVLTQIEKGETKEATIRRTFTDDEIHTVLSVDGVSCVRIFKSE